MSLVYVQTQQGRYPIQVSRNILGQIGTAIPIDASKIILISNQQVYNLYGEQVKKSLQIHTKEILTYFLPDGEIYKNLSAINDAYTFLLRHQVDRKAVIVALGGGIVGDMAGFIASTYMRGIRLIQVPTTLLAQVDASVGGKTGINHPLGKNLIGTFYQPIDVVIDIQVLKTLEPRHITAGLAEMFKYGLIMSPKFFSWCESNANHLVSLKQSAIEEAITQACQFKAKVVSEDEKESGLRTLLNFGHTFAHAIEAGTDYDGSWLHGEAVGCGMLMACRLSERLEALSPEIGDRLEDLLTAINCPITPPNFNFEKWLNLMKLDKKNQDGNIHCVLLEELGQAVITEVELSDLKDFLL